MLLLLKRKVNKLFKHLTNSELETHVSRVEYQKVRAKKENDDI